MSDLIDKNWADGENPAEILRSIKEDATTTIVLNRPERKNALSLDLRRQLLTAIKAAMVDNACRLIVLTGAGGSFSAGADIRETKGGMSDDDRRERLGLLHEIVRAIVLGHKPVIAAVDGASYGAGFSLAAACDLIVATERAEFCAAFARIGLMPDAGLLWTLPRRVGDGAARHLVMTARPVRGPEAKAMGLVDELVNSPAELRNATLTLARACQASAPMAIEAIKSALAPQTGTLDEVLRLEADAQPRLSASADSAEGKAAFFQKRQPSFVGK